MLGAAQTLKKKPVVMKSSLTAPPSTAKLSASPRPGVVRRPVPLGPLAQRRAAAAARMQTQQQMPPVVLPAPPLQVIPPGDPYKAFPRPDQSSITVNPATTPPIMAEKPCAWLKSPKVLIGGGLALVALVLLFRRKN